MSDVTSILASIEYGDSNATGQLLPLVYDELRKLVTPERVLDIANPFTKHIYALRVSEISCRR